MVLDVDVDTVATNLLQKDVKSEVKVDTQGE